MVDKQIQREASNLTDDSEFWQALNKIFTDSRTHATLVALDVALKGEDRVWQRGYAKR